MPKKQPAKPSPSILEPVPTSAGANEPKEVTFSIRLTVEEHDRLVQAARLRGWTPTNLIRTATLERAAHILNTARVTTFNFKGLAVRVADQLFKPRTYSIASIPFNELDQPVRVLLSHLDPRNGIEDLDPFSVKADLEALPIEVLSELKKAVRLGGSEFLIQILEYCEGVTASQRVDVPDPVEPTTSTA